MVGRVADVEVTREGAVLTITLNRPEVLNALNRSVHDGLRGALERAEDPDDPRRRDHRSRPRLLRRAGPAGVLCRRRRRDRQPAPQLSPQRACDPGAREAGDRGRQRAGSGSRPVTCARVRHQDRRRLGELRAGVHQHRARARLGRDVARASPPRHRPRVRVADDRAQARSGRGSLPGASRARSCRRTSSRTGLRRSRASTPRCQRGRCGRRSGSSTGPRPRPSPSSSSSSP